MVCTKGGASNCTPPPMASEAQGLEEKPPQINKSLIKTNSQEKLPICPPDHKIGTSSSRAQNRNPWRKSFINKMKKGRVSPNLRLLLENWEKLQAHRAHNMSFDSSKDDAATKYLCACRIMSPIRDLGVCRTVSLSTLRKQEHTSHVHTYAQVCTHMCGTRQHLPTVVGRHALSINENVMPHVPLACGKQAHLCAHVASLSAHAYV